MADVSNKSSIFEETNTQKSENWTFANRKRPRNNSPIEEFKLKRQTKIQDYWLGNPVKTNNPFQLLENHKENEESEPEKVTNLSKSPKSPPIFITGVDNICPLIELLNKIAANAYTIKTLSSSEVKILLHSPEKYIPITEELKKKNTQFYTYQMKQNRTYKCVLRNIHPSVNTDEIKTEIEGLGHKVVRISNIQQRETKKPLPLFFIELETNENNKDIYKINKLLNSIVSFEAPHKKREIPQCTRCQIYGHTKNYCNKTPVCVKCAKNHITSACPIKAKTKEVICANCGGDHPASYKGCIVRKQLQQKLFPTLRDKNHQNNTNYNTNKIQNQSNVNTVNPNISYAQATIGNVPSHQTINSPISYPVNSNENNNKLEIMISQLMSKIDTMLNLITSLISKL